MAPGRSSTARTASTRTEVVYDELRAELLNLNGRYEPGQRMRLLELGERFGASLSVIREALTRLAEQGLLVANPQRGFSVRELSAEDLTDLTRVRVQLETLAFRQAVAEGDVAWETAVVATHHTLERTPVTDADGQFNEAWSVAHRDFHEALLAGCGSPRLETIANSLRDSAELYRRWYWALADDWGRDVAAEHRQLRDYAIARQADEGATLLTDHIERAPRKLIEYIDSNSEPPVGSPAPKPT